MSEENHRILSLWPVSLLPNRCVLWKSVCRSKMLGSRWYNFQCPKLTLSTRDQFSAERGILSQAAEYAHFRGISVFTEFCGIRYWTVWYRGQISWIWHILVEFRSPYWFHHEIHDCHSGSDGRNTENIELSLSEILPVNLVDRLYLSVAVTGDKYRIFGQVQRP